MPRNTWQPFHVYGTGETLRAAYYCYYLYVKYMNTMQRQNIPLLFQNEAFNNLDGTTLMPTGPYI